jgi:DNA-binding MarR family transcriptional regulator
MSRQTADVSADHVEERRQQWRDELPDVDTIGMAILGRARFVTTLVRGPIERVFERHGLDTGEFDVLTTLLRSGEPYRLRPTELFRSLMISSGGLTDRLARLEEAGLVTRRPNDTDARSLLVELTKRGRKTAETAFREDMATEKSLLKGLSRQEREQLASLLARLTTVVADQTDEA